MDDIDVNNLSPAELTLYRAKKTLSKASLQLKSEKNTVRLLDKLVFMFGFNNVVLTTFVFSGHASWYPLLFTIKYVLLVGSRWIKYRVSGAHYFLLDFCYVVNASHVYYLWFAPHNYNLFLVNFTNALGPLLFAIPAWRNAFVFDIDKITSVFIHLSPVLLDTAIFWRLSRTGQFSVCPPQGCAALTFRDVYLIPFGFFMAWQVVYYVLIYKVLQDRLTRKNRMYSFSYTVKDLERYTNEKGQVETKKLGPMLRIMLFFGKRWIKEMFCVTQIFYTILTYAPMYWLLQSQVLEYLLVVCVSQVSGGFLCPPHFWLFSSFCVPDLPVEWCQLLL